MSRSALSLWFDLMEAGFHAGVTVERRLALMADAAGKGGLWSEPEVWRMGPEKMFAFAEGMQAASFAAMAEWQRLAIDPTRLGAASIAIARAASAPAHKAVRANARRLRRKRKGK